jgi:hypothetical protein
MQAVVKSGSWSQLLSLLISFLVAGREVKRFTSRRVFEGFFGLFRVITRECGTRRKSLQRRHLRALVRFLVVGRHRSSNLPPSARKFQNLRTHFSLWPPFGRFVNEGSSPPRSVRAVEPLNGIFVGQR